MLLVSGIWFGGIATMWFHDSGAYAWMIKGDCREGMRQLDDNSVSSIVTDPPYGLSKQPDMREVLSHWLAGDDYTTSQKGFMGKTWDSFVPVWRVKTNASILSVAKWTTRISRSQNNGFKTHDND